jgi:hypothetical protein
MHHVPATQHRGRGERDRWSGEYPAKRESTAFVKLELPAFSTSALIQRERERELPAFSTSALIQRGRREREREMSEGCGWVALLS